MRFRILVKQDEDRMFITEVMELPGCISQGTTREKAIASIKEAISGYIECLKQYDEPIPPSIDEEVIKVHV